MKKNIYVVGAVIVQNNKILCAQRGNSKALAHKWEFPGGKINEGETPEQALAREIQEELECSIEIGSFITKTSYEYDFGIVHLSTFYCKLLEGVPHLTEHQAIKWLLPSQLDCLDWAPADIPAVQLIMNQN